MYRPLAHKFQQISSRSRPVVGLSKSFNQFAAAAASVLRTSSFDWESLPQDQFKSSHRSHFNTYVVHPARRMSSEGAAGGHGHEHTNRLANERSTYLLQHAHNPVDWYPWGEEAIAKARAEDKLIFLSVGYSTCHWCHVMEKESFENPEIAEIMNRYFVNIKVDREERPDLDRLYMNFVVMINGSGGWPMSVWLTPDLAPISAGTYFPPVDRWGTPGFTSVLKMVHGKWTKDKENLTRVGLRVIDVMRQSTPGQCASECVTLSTEAKFNEAVQIFYRNVDPEWGGFGRAPKFPEVSKLNFLLHANTHKPDPEALSVPLDTLVKIAEGGIHDHIFGGFARYSVDRKWHVPHFEKMLYDQGQLMQAYVNSYKIKQNPLFLEVADNIFRYITKDLHHPEGAFYSGEDADSYPQLGDAEKIEGAFYAWEWQELKDIFDENQSKFQHAESFDIFCHYYGIEAEGNVEASSDPQGHLLTKNILMIQTTLEKTAEKYKTNVETVSALLKQFNEILHDIRERRPRPHLDTKIITSWNGLMLSGISKLAAVSVDLEKQAEYKKVAGDLVAFIRKHLYDAETKTIFRTCYGDGVDSATAASLGNPISGFLDDYAFLIKGLLDYYLVSLDPEILLLARDLQNTQDRLFWDSEHHGYYFSHENAANVVVRLKDDHDGAEPCGNSVSTNNLLLLHGYFEEEAFQTKASQVFDFFGKTTPFGYMLPEMMSAMVLFDTGSPLIVIVGPSDSDLVKEFMTTVRNFFIPGLVLIQHDPDHPDRTTRKSAKELKLVNNLPAAHICINQTCELPMTSVAELRAKLTESYLFI